MARLRFNGHNEAEQVSFIVTRNLPTTDRWNVDCGHNDKRVPTNGCGCYLFRLN